jgi:signal transduction histidine kinase/Tfp pilus assembly protein PilF
VDSLKTELKNCKTDSNKVKLLSQIAFAYSRSNIDSGLVYSKQALKLAESLRYKKLIAQALYSLASNYLLSGELDSSIINYQKILQITDPNDKILLASVNSNIALAHQRKSDYTISLEYYLKAIKLFKESSNYPEIYNVSEKMGLIYIKQGELHKAKDHYYSLYEIAKKNNDTARFSRIFKNFGNIYLQLDQLDSAEYYYNKSLKLDKKRGEKFSYAISLGNFANLFFKKKEYKKAESLYKEAIELEKEIGHREGLARNYANLGEMYFEIAKSSTEQRSKIRDAETYLISANLIYEKMGEKGERANIVDLLSELYSSKKDFEKAYVYKSKYAELKDSIDLLSSKNTMRNMEFLRDKKLRDAEIELLKAENEYKTNLSIFFIALTFLVGIIVYITFNFYNIKKKQNITLEQKIKERTQDLEEAKSELYKALSKERELSEMKTNFILTVSHEFRTPLTAISSTSMILEILGKDNPDIIKQNKKISKSVSQLNSIIQDILSYSKSDTDLIHPEFDEISIEDINNEITDWIENFEKFEHDLIIDNQIGSKNIRTDKKILLNSLKQILKNSIAFTDKGKKIILNYSENNDEYLIKIEDEGAGIDSKDIDRVFEPFFKAKKSIGIKSGTGLGLAIAKNYLEQIGGKIEISSKINVGTLVSIRLQK